MQAVCKMLCFLTNFAGLSHQLMQDVLVPTHLSSLFYHTWSSPSAPFHWRKKQKKTQPAGSGQLAPRQGLGYERCKYECKEIETHNPRAESLQVVYHDKQTPAPPGEEAPPNTLTNTAPVLLLASRGSQAELVKSACGVGEH